MKHEKQSTALYTHFGTSGEVQQDRPLVRVPRRSEDPCLPVPLVPRRSEDPLLLVPLVPRTPICANLCYSVVPLVLCQLSFLRFFFWVSQCHSVFRKTLEWKFTPRYYHVGEGKQQGNFHETTGDNRDHTLDHMGLFCLEFNSSTLWHQHTKQTLFDSTTHCV